MSVSCLNPSRAWQDMFTTNENGTHPVIWKFKDIEHEFEPRLVEGELEYHSDRYRELVIPCGKCLLCRKRRAEEIAIRALFEIKGYDPLQEHAFVTLTVDDEHMEEVFPGARLQHRPFQLFMKRMRKRGIDVRYLMCGEYGEKTHRPHYHAILFGWFPLDSYFDTSGCFHGSKLLEELWPFGHVVVDRVNSNRVFYVAGYTLKVGVDDDRWRPYVRWSRRPGLGSKYIDDYAWNVIVKKDVEWYQHNKFDTWYYRTFVGRKEVRFGSRYLDGRLALKDQDRFSIIKASRLGRIQIETEKLKASPEAQALAVRSLMNRAKSLDYQLATKSRELC